MSTGIEDSNFPFDMDKLWFLPLTNPARPNQLGLRIGVPGLTPSQFPTATAAARRAVEACLGAALAAEEVKHIDVAVLPDRPEKEGYVEFGKLVEFVTWRKTHHCEDDTQQ